MKNTIKKLTDKIKAALAERFIASEPFSAIFYELYASDNTLENEIADIRKELADLKSDMEEKIEYIKAEYSEMKDDWYDMRSDMDDLKFDLEHLEIPDEGDIEETVKEKMREALEAAINEL